MQNDYLIIDSIKLLLCAFKVKLFDSLSNDANREFEALFNKVKHRDNNTKDIF